MEYSRFVKKLHVSAGQTVPKRLTYQDIVARAISRADLQEDVRGINASLELIRRTRGGTWPTGEITEEFNFVDLVWHEAEFRDGGSYAYAVYETDQTYLGCCYLYPMGRRTRPDRGAHEARRGRELVGHAVCVRKGLLHEAVPCPSPLACRRAPVQRALLLQPGNTVGLTDDPRSLQDGIAGSV